MCREWLTVNHGARNRDKRLSHANDGCCHNRESVLTQPSLSDASTAWRNGALSGYDFSVYQIFIRELIFLLGFRKRTFYLRTEFYVALIACCSSSKNKKILPIFYCSRPYLTSPYNKNLIAIWYCFVIAKNLLLFSINN